MNSNVFELAMTEEKYVEFTLVYMSKLTRRLN